MSTGRFRTWDLLVTTPHTLPPTQPSPQMHLYFNKEVLSEYSRNKSYSNVNNQNKSIHRFGIGCNFQKYKIICTPIITICYTLHIIYTSTAILVKERPTRTEVRIVGNSNSIRVRKKSIPLLMISPLKHLVIEESLSIEILVLIGQQLNKVWTSYKPRMDLKTYAKKMK